MVIAVSPGATAPELVQALTHACSEALRPRVCEVREGAPPDVIIEWTSERSARLETRSGEAMTRFIEFREQDLPTDMWRSVGLVTAALVSRSTPPPAKPPPPPAPPVVKPEEPSLPRLWLGGGAVLGSGIEHGPVSFGGKLHGAYRIPELPIFVAASGSHAAAGAGPNGIEAKWTTVSLGAGVVFGIGNVAVRPRLDAVFASLVAESADPQPRGSSGSRKLVGAGAGVELAWPSTDRFSLVLGAEGTFLSGGTSIRFAESRISAFPALEYRFLIGVEAAVLR